MLGKAFGGALRLSIDGRAHEIRSAAELDGLLQNRVSPSSDRLSELVALGDRDLFAAKAGYLDHESYLEELVNAWMAGGSPPSAATDAPHDQGWNVIMAAIVSLGRADDGMRFVAIERYRQYLRAALRCLEGIARGRLNQRHDDSSVGRLMDMPGNGASTAMVQQLLFDLRELADDSTAMHGLERLPKGEPCSVKFAPHQSMRIRLAKYDFTLVSGSQFLLIDDTGGDLRLPPGRVILGRGNTCSVMLDARYRSISRKHVIVQIADDGTVAFTDVSSMGTFLPARSA